MSQSNETVIAVMQIRLEMINTELTELKQVVKTNEDLLKNASTIFRLVGLLLTVGMPLLGAVLNKYLHLF